MSKPFLYQGTLDAICRSIPKHGPARHLIVVDLIAAIDIAERQIARTHPLVPVDIFKGDMDSESRLQSLNRWGARSPETFPVLIATKTSIIGWRMSCDVPGTKLVVHALCSLRSNTQHQLLNRVMHGSYHQILGESVLPWIVTQEDLDAQTTNL